MNDDQTIKKLNIIFKDVFDDEELSINRNIKINEIKKWDSLGQLRLMMKIEEEFEVDIDINDVNEISSVQDIILLINKVS